MLNIKLDYKNEVMDKEVKKIGHAPTVKKKISNKIWQGSNTKERKTDLKAK